MVRVARKEHGPNLSWADACLKELTTQRPFLLYNLTKNGVLEVCVQA